MDPLDLTRLGNQSPFVVDNGAFFTGLLLAYLLQNHRQVVRVDELRELAGCPLQDLFDGVPADVGGRLVGVLEFAVLNDVDPHEGLIGEYPELLFALYQRLLGALALGDILYECLQVGECSVRFQHPARRHVYFYYVAVLVVHIHLGKTPIIALQGIADDLGSLLRIDPDLPGDIRDGRRSVPPAMHNQASPRRPDSLAGTFLREGCG